MEIIPTAGPMDLAGLQQVLPLLEQQFHLLVYSYYPKNMKNLQRILKEHTHFGLKTNFGFRAILMNKDATTNVFAQWCFIKIIKKC